MHGPSTTGVLKVLMTECQVREQHTIKGHTAKVIHWIANFSQRWWQIGIPETLVRCHYLPSTQHLFSSYHSYPDRRLLGCTVWCSALNVSYSNGYIMHAFHVKFGCCTECLWGHHWPAGLTLSDNGLLQQQTEQLGLQLTQRECDFLLCSGRHHSTLSLHSK